ncbi:MAG: DUF5074 domain-containing protein [Bacteroidota bacterium]
MNLLKITAAFLTFLLFFVSCSEDDQPELPKGDYEKGYFISNEGPFNNGSGTITHVGEDDVVSQNIYKTVNDEDLGNIVQFMALSGDNAYFVVNNSHKIVVANRYTMKKITTIEGENINNPRYFVANNDRGYVSNWGDPLNPNDDFISIIDLNSNEIISTISVGEGPEDMLIENNDLYVNLQGGWSQNNKVEVIDLQSNIVSNTLIVGDVPNSLVTDGRGNIWVLCGGKPSWTGFESGGKLAKITTSGHMVELIDFDVTEHPEHLTINSEELYYNLNGKVYEMIAQSSSLPESPIDGIDGFFYAMKANNGELFATDPIDFQSEGSLKVFNLSSGALIETIQTGILPGTIIFQ